MHWTPTHVVPDVGMASWPAPDPAQPQGPLVPGRLDVQVVEWSGAWARIRCSNDWGAWVDGRLLVDRAAPIAAPPPMVVPPPGPTLIGPAPPVPVAASAPLPAPPPRYGPAAVPAPAYGPAPAPAPSARQAGLRGALEGAGALGVGPLTIGGAALLVTATFLPWYSFGVGLTAWDLPVAFLATGKNQVSGFKIGLLLVAMAALVVLPLVTRRPQADRRLPVAAGGLSAATGVVALIRLLVEDEPKPDLGIGILLAIAGGGLIAYESRRAR